MNRSQLGYGLHAALNVINLLKLLEAVAKNERLKRCLDSLVGQLRNLNRAQIAFDGECKRKPFNAERILEALHELRLGQVQVMDTIDLMISLAGEAAPALERKSMNLDPQACSLDCIVLESPLNGQSILFHEQLQSLKLLAVSAVHLIILANEKWLQDLQDDKRKELAKQYFELHINGGSAARYLPIDLHWSARSWLGDQGVLPRWFDEQSRRGIQWFDDQDILACIKAWIKSDGGNKIEALFPGKPRVFVSGHADLRHSEFWDIYRPALDRYVAAGAEFLVGDSDRGTDSEALLYLGDKGVKIKVFHTGKAPRHSRCLPTIGGFPSEVERDSAMTNASDLDLAWVRPGHGNSSVTENLHRRLRLTRVLRPHPYARGVAVMTLLQGRYGRQGLRLAVENCIALGSKKRPNIDGFFTEFNKYTHHAENSTAIVRELIRRF
ncbi:MAG: hypothetical protein K2W82_10860 [Candidatus Obscuribacterales bacterium]|nr:hypothetical protein [Candidatus Obscuribacterales bacterium]